MKSDQNQVKWMLNGYNGRHYVERVLQSRLIRGFTLHSVLMTVPLRYSKTESNYIVVALISWL